MLTDQSKSDQFRNSRHWKSPLLDFQLRVENKQGSGPAFQSNSLSGNERNRLLLSTEGTFKDYSLVSGVDCREDARSFAIFDYDQDGWLDIALASANAPRLRIFRNQIGELTDQERLGRLIRLTLIGTESNRDGCGAVVTIETNLQKRAFRKSLGEGLSAQNSGFIPLTFAAGETVKSLTVQWPSCKVSKPELKPNAESLEVRE